MEDPLMRHPRDIRGLLAFFCALLLILSLACGRAGDSADGDEQATAETDGEKKNGDEDGEEENEEEAVPVEVVALEHGPIETVLRFSTNLEAENDVQVVSQASRQLQVRQLLVEEGAEVGRGQVLLRLENAELRTALARIEGQLEKARREYDRQTSLYGQQLISEQIYNDATYELEQLELSLEDSQRELGYTEVRAPIAGTVTERHVSVGDQVTANQMLFRIVDFDSIVARVYVPEKDLWRISEGLEARLYTEANRSIERRGAIERVAPQVDPRSGTVKATIGIPRGAGLLPGMYVSVELITAVNAEAVLVPKKALIYDAEQIYVFRLAEEDRVERLLIEARLEDRDNIEPAGELAVGERIVIAGQAGLKDGSLVRLIDAAAEEAVAEVDAEAGDEAAESTGD
jgi:membrane fusion protein (multidrug efflux system)